MTRLEDTRAAIVHQLSLLKAKADKPISLFDIGIPLSAAGFTLDEIVDALFQLQRDKDIELITGNHLRVTRDIA